MWPTCRTRCPARTRRSGSVWRASTTRSSTEDYAGIPWFWSNQGDLKLQIAGLSLGYDTTVVRRDEEQGKFSVLYYRDGRIIAADCINHPLDFMAVRNALAKGQEIPAAEAADATVPLKSLIRNLEPVS